MITFKDLKKIRKLRKALNTIDRKIDNLGWRYSGINKYLPDKEVLNTELRNIQDKIETDLNLLMGDEYQTKMINMLLNELYPIWFYRYKGKIYTGNLEREFLKTKPKLLDEFVKKYILRGDVQVAYYDCDLKDDRAIVVSDKADS